MEGRREGFAAVAAIALLGAGLLLPGGAGAEGEPKFGCGHEHTGKAQRNPNPKGKPPLIIGDSATLLPIPNLNRAGFSVNGKGCRGFKNSIKVMHRYLKLKRLPHLVLIFAYSNGGVNMGLIDRALEVAGPTRVLGLVTQYNADNGQGAAPATEVLFQAAQTHPTRIEVFDWVAHSAPHHSSDDWFLPDLYHPNFAGAQAFADFLRTALPLARNGRFPS